MRVGIVADTHGLLRAEVLEAFAGVEHVLHAGDIGSLEVLAGLAAVAPVTAVWGNVDPPDVRALVPEVAHVELAGVSVVVVHGDQFGSPTAAKVAGAHPDVDLAVFGHSHRPVSERLGTTHVVNPGSAGRRRFRNPVTVALAELEAGHVEARLVALDGPACRQARGR